MSEPDYIEFGEFEPHAVVGRMAGLAESRDGWINFQPAVAVEDAPAPKAGLFALFSARGPEVPLATWTPGAARRGRPEPPSVGLQHPTGPGAKARLAAAGHAVPQGWVVLQDHSKRGLVVAVPPQVPHAEVVAWLLRAARQLSIVPLTGRWRAAVYGP